MYISQTSFTPLYPNQKHTQLNTMNDTVHSKAIAIVLPSTSYVNNVGFAKMHHEYSCSQIDLRTSIPTPHLQQNQVYITILSPIYDVEDFINVSESIDLSKKGKAISQKMY